MLGLLLVMVVVTGIIIFVLLQTKTTTTASKTQATKTTTTTAVQTQKADNERKYIESLKVLSNLSESHRLQPYKYENIKCFALQ
jgi:ABC-type protease/lipase transport system fused ATPase/permease subunit